MENTRSFIKNEDFTESLELFKFLGIDSILRFAWHIIIVGRRFPRNSKTTQKPLFMSMPCIEKAQIFIFKWEAISLSTEVLFHNSFGSNCLSSVLVI